MTVHFTKMHGIGNDYIYINCLDGIPFEPADLSIKMSARRFSVGADGVILICHSDCADAMMRIFNADGSEGKMCGNGIRCVGKYLYDKGIISKTETDIETLSGIKHLSLSVKDGKVDCVTVDMGKAVTDGKKIPSLLDGEIIMHPIKALGSEYRITAISMGNPHAVIFTEDPYALELEKIGPVFEHCELFPEGVNTEFVRVISENELLMRVWERGSGETWACGTGACAVVVAAQKNGICRAGELVTVHLRGGDLKIECDADLNVKMTGPAALSYEGDYLYEL